MSRENKRLTAAELARVAEVSEPTAAKFLQQRGKLHPLVQAACERAFVKLGGVVVTAPEEK